MPPSQQPPLPATYSWPLEVGVKWRRKKTKSRAPAVNAAKLERQRSERLKKQAQSIARDLHEIRRENHFADALRALIEGDDQ